MRSNDTLQKQRHNGNKMTVLMTLEKVERVPVSYVRVISLPSRRLFRLRPSRCARTHPSPVCSTMCLTPSTCYLLYFTGHSRDCCEATCVEEEGPRGQTGGSMGYNCRAPTD